MDPGEAYRRGAVESAPSATLVLMLYRGAIRFIRQAAEAIERQDVETAHACLMRAQSIVLTLRSGLRPEMGPMAQNLDSVYDYFLRRLMEANVAKDRAAALEVAALLESLLDAWEDVVRSPAPPRMPGDGQKVPRVDLRSRQ